MHSNLLVSTSHLASEIENNLDEAGWEDVLHVCDGDGGVERLAASVEDVQREVVEEPRSVGVRLLIYSPICPSIFPSSARPVVLISL